MGRRFSVYDLDKAMQERIVNDLKNGVCEKDISEYCGLARSCINRFKHDLIKRAADDFFKERREMAVDYATQIESNITRLNKMLETVDEELRQGREDGKYNLKNIDRALALSKILNDTSKSMQGNLQVWAQITGNMKEAAEAQNRPAIILAKIQQIIQEAGVDNAIIIRAFEQLR